MNNPITRIALLEDCIRLTESSTEVEPLFVEVLRTKPAMSRLGAIAPVEAAWIEAGLQRLRDTWEEPDVYPEPRHGLVVGNPSREGKLAFCLSGLINLTYNALLATAPSQEESHYQEAYIFQQVYLKGHEEAFQSFLETYNTNSSSEAMEGFVQALFLRSLAASHTIMPDTIMLNQWLDNVHMGVDVLSDVIQRQVQVLYQPDPIRQDQYQITTTFYNDDDPVIELARILQRGGSVDISHVQEALVPHANKSSYGCSLAMGLTYLRNASTFWWGERDSLEMPDELLGRRAVREASI